MYEVSAQGAAATPELPFFDRGTWEQSVARARSGIKSRSISGKKLKRSWKTNGNCSNREPDQPVLP